MASPYDLVSLTDLKAWLGIMGDDDDALLAQLITQVSRAIFNVLDRPSILPQRFTETFDGDDGAAVALRQWPVNSIVACSINGQSIPPAPSLGSGGGPQKGYVLEAADATPPGRMQLLSLRRQRFTRGVQNITVSYSAGYQISGESAIVPSSGPYVIPALAPYGDLVSDGGATYANGAPLSPVATSPAAGQYTVTNGVYTFSSADRGASILLTYGYVPADIALSCIDWAAERYSYRSRIGQQSKSLGGQETIAFIVKDLPDFVATLLQPYRRVIAP